MSGTRFSLGNGFIPDPMPQALVDKLPEIRAGLRWLMSFAKPINAGQPNEEPVIRGTYHKCYHDENANKPCEPEQEI